MVHKTLHRKDCAREPHKNRSEINTSERASSSWSNSRTCYC